MNTISERISNIEVGSVLLFKESRKGFVAWDEDGRAVISRVVKETGFFKVTAILKKAPTFTIVEVERTICDLYPGISPDEAKKVLEKFGFKFVERPFTHKGPYDIGYRKESQIFAYHLASGIVGIGETWDNRHTFNSFDFTCPGLNGINIYSRVGQFLGFSSGSGVETTFDFEHSRCDNFLKRILSMQGEGRQWTEENGLHLWTYADKSDNILEMFRMVEQRIFLFPEEAQNMLKNSRTMRDAIKNRSDFD